jgi:Histidine phosphatase superfamily (branch 1)
MDMMMNNNDTTATNGTSTNPQQPQSSQPVPRGIRVQKLIFIRHGIAKHNLLSLSPSSSSKQAQRPNLHDPSLWDPPLVYDGKIKAVEAGERLRYVMRHNKHQFMTATTTTTTTFTGTGGGGCGGNSSSTSSSSSSSSSSLNTTFNYDPKPELVISSPLTRCLQTTMLMCGPGDIYTSSTAADTASNPHPGRGEGSHQHVEDSEMEVNRKEPKYLCNELCREAYGIHYPDKRRSLSLLQKYWPIFEFDPTMTEDDEAWKPDQRETINDVQRRATQFLELIVNRSESIIIVVSHGVFIETLLNTYCPDALLATTTTTVNHHHQQHHHGHGHHGGQHQQRVRIYNCDMYCVDCISCSCDDLEDVSPSDNITTDKAGGAGERRRLLRLQNPFKI